MTQRETSQEIYFYIPKHEWPTGIPSIFEVGAIVSYIRPLGTPTTLGTIYNWILQTYLWLRADGYSCTLVGELPNEGIVITYWGSLPINFMPSSRLLVVSVLADGFYPHPYTQLRIVQNRQQALMFRDSYFIPHWPQPGLIKRDPKVGNRFQNVGYFGHESNLASEIKSLSWQTQLQDLGLKWCVIQPDDWHDYSNIDVVLAIRSFGKNNSFDQKPATKLYNAWHAGVPALLGYESAYRAERNNELDYLEVSSSEEILVALKKLCDNVELRQKIVKNGLERATATSIQNLTKCWRDFITQVALPAHKVWTKKSSIEQQTFFAKRYVAKKINGLKYRLKLAK